MADPSNEGNSEEKLDNISDEDPADEEPVEEEPSEGDVEEVEEPTISLMDNEPPADTEEGIYNVTLPANSKEYKVTGNPKTAKDEDYTFKVTAEPGYRIDTVTYKVGDEEAKTAAGTDGNYTIKNVEIKADIVISVTAVQTFKVTVTAPPDTVTLQYTVGTDSNAQNMTAGTPVIVDKDAEVSLTVTPKDATIDVTAVKKGNTTIEGEANVYALGKITADAAYTVTAAKNRYKITETINKITVPNAENEGQTEAVPAATIDYDKSGSDYTAAKDSDPQMITKSKDLKFELKYDDYFNEKTPKVVVSYKVGTAETATTLTASNGVYTIPKAKINGDIALNVYVDEYKTFAVTMQPDENVDKIECAIGTANLEEPSKDSDGNYESISVTEDSVLNFKVTPKKYYKIKEVKAGDEVLTGNKGVYTLTVTKAEKITVTTELDPAQQRNLTFKVTGDAKSASASIKDGLEETYSVEAGGTVNNLAATTGDELTLTITPKDGYIIKSVTGATAVPVTTQADTDTNAKQYTVKFTTAKTATVTVTTDADESTKESIVTFEEDGSVAHMSYNVKNGGTTKVTKDEDGKYTVAKGAKKLEFSITVTGSYKPTVMMAGKDVETGGEEGGVDAREADAAKEIEYAKMTPTKTGATYDYMIPATQLKDENSVTISESRDEREFKLTGNLSNVDIVASQDGKKITLPEVANDSITYTTLLNDTLAFQITAKNGVTLKTVTSQVGESGKVTPAKVTNGVANVEIKATDNVTIAIKTDDQYVASNLKENGTDLKPADAAKNSYNVAYNGTYTATVVRGKDSTAVALSEVKVLSGNASVAAKTEGQEVGTYSNNVATINLSNADTKEIAGKTLTVELWTKEGTENENGQKVATYSLIVSVPATGILIDRKDALEATQAIDTTKTYTVTAAKGVDLNKLVVAEIKDEKGIIAATADENDDNQEAKAATPQVKYENGKLTVTMAAKKPVADATATITIKEQGATGDDASKATLTIKAAELINGNTTAPTVKLVAATDAAFKLTLSAKTAQSVSGNLYYKIESKEKEADGDFKATYVQKAGDSQTAMVTVSDASKVAEYEVKASLVHLDKAVTNETTLADNTETLGESKASNAQKLKTQTPAYEDKLKLKKGKTTIVTGEKDIVIAEPQYNKYTTFLSLAQNGAVKDITPNLGTEEALTVDVRTVGLDEKITATATQATKIGKHKIQVTASAEDGAYASVATIDVTVVRGIHKLGVTVPSTNLYKANKKPAKVKATVVYNQDITSPAPKNKSVTWEIVAQGSNQSYIEKMVTVNNGTVNVDKNFIVDTVEENNQFKIKVTANNTKTFAGGTYNSDGNLVPIVAESSVITITNTGEDIKTIVIVKDNKIVAFPTGTKDPCEVDASDINGGTVVVLSSKAAAPQKDATVEDANKIGYSLITLKSSNQKSVPVEANGEITVNKVGKVKLTATAKDGSNKKAELSLNIINDKTEGDLGLSMYEAEYTKGGQPQAKSPVATVYDFTAATTTDIKYDFSETPVVQLKVQQKVTPENGAATYPDVPEFANFSLTVTGGKIVQQKGAEAYVAINAKTVTVKLTDKSKKSDNVATYVLTNTGADMKPTFKAKNKLHSKGTADEQTTNIEVTKLAANLEAKENLVAKVAVDWSAKNTKNEDDLKYLAGILKDEYSLEAVKLNASKFELSFESSTEINLNQKSYKLTVTLYEKAEAGNNGATYTAVTAPTSMTVSVESAKKFTYKPTTSYTLKTKDVKASAELTGKASVTDGCTVTWSDLQNLNTKGKTNKFATYFMLETKDGKQYIKLAKLTDKDQLPDKVDCTGYITYTATAAKNYHSDKAVTGTVKITVKFDDKKPAATYSQLKVDNKLPEIFLTTGSKTPTGITAKVGKDSPAAAKLSYVTVDNNDKTSKDFTVVKGDTDGAIELTYIGSGLQKNKTYKVKLYIVPTTSYYSDIIDKEVANQTTDEGKAEKAAELTAQYGIPVTVQVKAIEAPIVAKTYVVAITEGPSTVAQGSNTATYTAEVTEDGTKLEGATVTWNVEAKENSTLVDGTGIDADGKLTVAAGQLKDSALLITATYTPEGGTPVSSEAKEVTVTEAAGGGGGV